MSFSFRRSQGSSGNNTKASGHSVRETRDDEGEYEQLTEWSVARGTSGDLKNPTHPGHGNASSFVASSVIERGKRTEADRAF